MSLKEFKGPTPEILGELYEKSDCFRGQRKGEYIETILMRHKIVLLPAFLITIIGGFGVIGINMLIREFFTLELVAQITFLIDFVFIAFVTHFFFISMMNFYLTMVIITNLRLIDLKYTTIFARNMDTLDLHNIQDINIMQNGFWRWLFNFGRITMHNASGNELFDFTYLKNPLRHYNIINHVHFKAMNSRVALQKEMEKKEKVSQPKQTDWNDE